MLFYIENMSRIFDNVPQLAILDNQLNGLHIKII